MGKIDDAQTYRDDPELTEKILFRIAFALFIGEQAGGAIYYEKGYQGK
jgi:hypothetical protein